MAASNHVDSSICDYCRNKLTARDRPLSCAKGCGRRCHRREKCSSLKQSKERDLPKEGIWTCSFCSDRVTDKDPRQDVKRVVELIQSSGPEILKSMMIAENWDPKSKDRNHYNYLYLDPRRNISNILDFIASIFYVGKGKDDRMRDHCKETADYLKKLVTQRPTTVAKSEISKKIQTIRDLWDGGRGPIIFCCIKGRADKETFNREAAMIDAIGVDNLTNKNEGQYQGMLKSIASRADGKEECKKLGRLLLHDAFETFTSASADDNDDKREFMKKEFVAADAAVATNGFVCKECGMVCMSKGGLTTHRRRMHEESEKKKVFQCEVCEAEFKQEANLLKHKKVCGAAVGGESLNSAHYHHW